MHLIVQFKVDCPFLETHPLFKANYIPELSHLTETMERIVINKGSGKESMDVSISNFPNLKTIYIGEFAFPNAKNARFCNLQQLTTLSFLTGCFPNCTGELAIYYCPRLGEICMCRNIFPKVSMTSIRGIFFTNHSLEDLPILHCIAISTNCCVQSSLELRCTSMNCLQCSFTVPIKLVFWREFLRRCEGDHS